jgi:hypothetical protein
MIALRFLARTEWEAKLRQYHCAPVAGLGRLNTAEWWRAKWNFLFTVPIEADGSLYQKAFQDLIADLMRSAPPDIRFD